MSPKIRFLLLANLTESPFNCPVVSTITSAILELPVNFKISASNTPNVLWSDDIVVIPFNVFTSKLSPFSPLLSLTSFNRGVPSDGLVALINNSGFEDSITKLSVTFNGFIIVNPSLLVVLILPDVNTISASVEFSPAVTEPLILIPALVVICPLNVTLSLNIAAPDTFKSPSNNVFPSETRRALEEPMVILLPADGAPLICKVDAFVVVTLVRVAANVPLFKVYKSVEFTVAPAAAEVLVYIWFPSIPESNNIPLAGSENDLPAISRVNLPVILLLIVSWSCDVILPELVMSLIPAKLDELSTISAFPESACPPVTPDNLFNSSALALTRVSPSWRPASTPLWDNTLSISFPLDKPIFTSPEELWVTTFPSADCPGVTPFIKPIVFSDIVCAPITRLPPTVILLLIAAASALKEPVVVKLLVPISIAPESLTIEPSAIVISPTFELLPAIIVPDVLILLEPILIVAVSLVIEPFAIVISANFEFSPAVIIPVVDTLLLPILIVGELLVIDPSEIVTSPNLELLAAVIIPEVLRLFAPIEISGLSLVIEPLAKVISANFEPTPVVTVPDVVRLLSENDTVLLDELISLPLIVIFPNVLVPEISNVEEPDIAPTLKSPAVISPDSIVPVVNMLLEPIVIVFVSLVIEPFAIVTSPSFEPEADSIVDVNIPFLPIKLPVVETLLVPIVIVALLLIIAPSEIVTSPILVPEFVVKIPVVVRLLFEKSISLVVDVILSPEIVTLPNVTAPVTTRLVLQIIEFTVKSPRVDEPDDSIAPNFKGI